MKPTYNPVTKILHWLVFVLLAIEFTIAWTMPGVHRGGAPTAIVNLHFSFGILILIVIIIRTLWRITHPTPPFPESMSHREKVIASAMHYALYAVLFIMPFTGWAWASSRGWAITFFNLFPVPPIVAEGSIFGQQAGGIHSFLGGLLVALIALHALAGLYHHFIQKDDVLRRMLP